MRGTEDKLFEESRQAAEEASKHVGLTALQYWSALGVALFGGIASFMHRFTKDRPWQVVLTLFTIQIVLSGFTGLITASGIDALAQITDSTKMASAATFFAGIGGFMGARALRLFEEGFESVVRKAFRLPEKPSDP